MKIGLLAGVGTLPVEFLTAVKAQGYEVVCIAVVPGVDSRLKELADSYYEISPFKLDKVIRTLRGEGVKEVTMIGKVTKEWLFKKHSVPDIRTLRVLNRLRKANFKDDTVTREIIAELAKDGISVLDQTKYLKPFMPGPQVFTRKKPDKSQMEDIAFGFKTAKLIGSIDLGQTVVVKNKAVMAVEAIEGTDACIRRGGQLARNGAVVVKTAKPQQDSRFDVPAVGLQTILSMEESNCAVLAIEAYKTFLAERDKVIEEANRKGLVVLSVEQDSL